MAIGSKRTLDCATARQSSGDNTATMTSGLPAPHSAVPKATRSKPYPESSQPARKRVARSPEQTLREKVPTREIIVIDEESTTSNVRSSVDGEQVIELTDSSDGEESACQDAATITEEEVNNTTGRRDTPGSDHASTKKLLDNDDRARLWKCAMEADLRGDIAASEMFYRLLKIESRPVNAVCAAPRTPPASTVKRATKKLMTSDIPVKSPAPLEKPEKLKRETKEVKPMIVEKIIEEVKPIIKKETPIIEKENTMIEEENPITEKENPMIVEEKPKIGEKIVEEEKRIIDEKIVEGDTTIVEGDTTIVEGDTTIVEGDTAIIDEKIVEGDKGIIDEKIVEGDKAIIEEEQTIIAEKMVPDEPITTSERRVKEPVQEEGLLFATGVVTEHINIGYHPFFEKNIRELKSPLPLTIFNKEWQEKTLTCHLHKRPKLSQSQRYAGHSYPNEWSQSFRSWTMNHRNFHLALRDIYGLQDFADKMLKHKENVDHLQSVYGFLPAFRYDLLMRHDTFSRRVMIDSKPSPPDISKLRKDFWDSCYHQSQKLDELRFDDNPYRYGGSRWSWDPYRTDRTVPKEEFRSMIPDLYPDPNITPRQYDWGRAGRTGSADPDRLSRGGIGIDRGGDSGNKLVGSSCDRTRVDRTNC
ncbi:hypothetical protein PSTT_13750 [Puccinia striiformis]|uniref:Uncharacterized protein n=1 Tax=Puccinia striiformis TaxID=27350 RepID=A0A2S4UQU0_9BASI|nr:hypothetical protein PSTT_13750 [Puccinia striiformis]